ncbi:MAG: carbamoyl-phosphate synthase (glutamine-hydrolyzing) large subunit [Bacteroidales bacterium]|nr:carbamoyl-phosphate synthase (glutamine-hydrolyzing) large subunit [Bacteroidales bacterium]
MDKSIKKVILLGSGALKIGEAGEFDYSGSQAIKAMREEGIETILINPNIATVQTSEGVADKIYFLPVTPFYVEKVIQKEKPQGILLAFGGQTALNCGVKLYEQGILEKYNLKVLGTPVQAIMDTEDRELFVKKLDEIDVKTIKSHAVENIEDAVASAAELGYPVIIRAAYALGGLGSGFCDNEEELRKLAEKSFSYSPQVLVEKSLKGWKEIEFEVMRDRFDNCIAVCNMENFDPLGIHTGESIVVAPCQTLTNQEVVKLRELAIRIVKHVGIVGECNVQFAFDTNSEDYRVIEVNARLSRSSALASKATGYPLAFVAAKLGLGYGLFDLKNSVTKTTPAFFEPTLDYVVCKIPRWDLSKFHGVSREIGSSMKSVGEVMSIGRTFEETIQKGLRMIGQGAHGFVANKEIVVEDIDKALRQPTDKRIFVISKAFNAGYTVEQIHELTKIDRWFLDKLYNIKITADELRALNTLEEVDFELLKRAKCQGFSDFQVGRLVLKDSIDGEEMAMAVRNYRKGFGLAPVVKQIDTLAAEYPAQANYLYLTYNGTKSDVDFKGDRKSIIVLGSGAYRIGSSVEFDWCSVNALQTIRKSGWRGVMINYNPETVSTDYDMCDRLYFDELTFERVMDIHDLENPHGMVVSVGGQIPNNLAIRLDANGVNLLGTSASSIDNAEDRHKFSSLMDELGIDQPKWKELTSLSDIHKFVEQVGYPVLVRPSYVLSGAAMNVCSNDKELEEFLSLAANVSKKHPVVVSEFVRHAKEIEFDAVAENGKVIAYAISEHIEFAGVHSGDATIQFPPQKLYVETARRIKKIARKTAEALKISGPFNMQFLAKENDIKVIECNLRASRSFPFVSKVLKINFIELATKVMIGEEVTPPAKSAFDLDYVGIKASQFSFARLQKADPILGVDMASTGEVGCIGDNTDEAILKSMLSVGYSIPKKNILISSGDAKQKAELLKACRLLADKGYTIYATGGSHKYLSENNIPSIRAYWPTEEGNEPQALEMLQNKQIDMVINIPKNMTHTELTNGYRIRRAAVDFNIPLITNTRLASAFIISFCNMTEDEIEIKSWDEYK